MEERQALLSQELKQHFFVVIESIKPLNIVRHTLKEAVSSPDLLSNILSTTPGLTVGYLSKRTLIGV